MHPFLHLAVTLIFLAYAFARESSLLTLILVFFFSSLIDLDHFLTYLLAEESLTLNPFTLYRWYNNEFAEKNLDLNKYLFLFHEVEVVLACSAILVAIPEPLPYIAYLVHQGMDWIHRLNMGYNTPSLFKYVSRQ